MSFKLLTCKLFTFFLVLFLVNGSPNCPLSCQDANQNCKSNCRISSDGKNKAHDNINVVTLDVDEPLPPDIQTDDPVPITWPRKENECRGVDLLNTKNIFPGPVTRITSECEEETNFEKKMVSIKWGPPEKYKTHRVSGYEIKYTVITDTMFDPLAVECKYLSNETRGTTIPKSIGKNQHLYITVVAHPAYMNLSSTTVRVDCLEVKTNPLVLPTETSTEGDKVQKPLDIALIIGCVAGSICFLLFVGITVRLFACSKHFGRFWQQEKNSENFGSNVSIGSEIMQQYERQLTRETVLRGSMMTIHSNEMEPKRSLKTAVPDNDFNLSQSTKVYISYYPDSDEFKSSLLSLVARLRNHYHINVIIDELDNRTIDKLGLANWCTANLTKADKIMMVVTPKYIQALKHNDIEVNNIHDSSPLDKNVLRKIRLETHYINSKLFIQNQRCSSLVVMLAGTKETDLPSYLSGRNHYEWPTLETDSERRLIYCLNEIEDFMV